MSATPSLNASPRQAAGVALQNLALALMIGGMLALGAFTAPAAFSYLPREQAASLMALLFRRYDGVLGGAMILVWVGEGLRGLTWRGWTGKTRLVLLLVLFLTLECATGFINPQIEQANRAGVHRALDTLAGRRFDQTHRLSENLYKLDLLLAALVLLLNPFVPPVPRHRSPAERVDV